MTHKHYYKIKADHYYDAGLQLGRLFGHYTRPFLKQQKRMRSFAQKVIRSQSYLTLTTQAFPDLIDELKGYAQGAEVSFDDLWVLFLEDELDTESRPNKCTTVITNNGLLLAHNEDWDPDSQDAICILRKTIGGTTLFELFYLNTLGGNALSINSNGYMQTINTLQQIDPQIGIPKNIIARRLAETASPEKDFSLMATLQRASGYNHNLVSKTGTIWNIESRAREQVITRPNPPFIHTNHFLTSLKNDHPVDNQEGTLTRLTTASRATKPFMSTKALQTLMSNKKQGKVKSIFNRSTIARMIIDQEKNQVLIWLLREKHKGWVSYDLKNIY